MKFWRRPVDPQQITGWSRDYFRRDSPCAGEPASVVLRRRTKFLVCLGSRTKFQGGASNCRQQGQRDNEKPRDDDERRHRACGDLCLLLQRVTAHRFRKKCETRPGSGIVPFTLADLLQQAYRAMRSFAASGNRTDIHRTVKKGRRLRRPFRQRNVAPAHASRALPWFFRR